MKIGYARVSTDRQSLDLQIDALKNDHCNKIYAEKISSRKKDRPELIRMIGRIKSGDIVVCYKLDRLGRSLRELLDLMTLFEEKKVRFISLSDGIDTATSSSKLILNIMMCIADFERDLIRERTIAGLSAAKKRGVKLGRPKDDGKKALELQNEIRQLKREGKTPTEIHRILGISRPTVYKYLGLQKPLI